jgi:hypothetical protein
MPCALRGYSDRLVIATNPIGCLNCGFEGQFRRSLPPQEVWELKRALRRHSSCIQKLRAYARGYIGNTNILYVA